MLIVYVPDAVDCAVIGVDSDVAREILSLALAHILINGYCTFGCDWSDTYNVIGCCDD